MAALDGASAADLDLDGDALYRLIMHHDFDEDDDDEDYMDFEAISEGVLPVSPARKAGSAEAGGSEEEGDEDDDEEEGSEEEDDETVDGDTTDQGKKRGPDPKAPTLVGRESPGERAPPPHPLVVWCY